MAAYGNFQSLIDAALKSGKESQDTLSGGYAKALEELTGAYGEAKGIYDKMLQSDELDPNSSAAAMMGLISTGFNDAMTQLSDVQARGGFAGSPNVEGMITSMVKGLAPQILSRYDTAADTKRGIEGSLAQLAMSMGGGKAGLATGQAKGLSDLQMKLSEQVGGYGQTAAQEELKDTRAQNELQNRLALAGIITDKNVLAANAGVDPKSISLKNIGGATGGGGTGVGGVGGGDSMNLISGITKLLSDIGGGTESYAGSLYTRPGESAFDVLDRGATARSLQTSRTNLSNQLMQASSPTRFRL